ncbi:CLUMA_CG021360, isoform A [Clunio marinus]|uniref:CLUMA_CG021360, isoform A n=1 Tax=Clunio marinus TaxID=568069 RepID=A0A1J1J7A6_9DIPT|nr:CLUMA_CG021360, isoform A [Clunio marinus]
MTALNISQVWQKGWPLALSQGALILHLGAIEESLVRSQDIFLCFRSESNVAAKLYACWRSSTNDTIVYHALDPEKHPITPLSIEMLAGEDLPQLLQTLLVGVEHAICRIPLDELTFPQNPSVSSSNHHHNQHESETDGRNSTNKRVECNLKRRELITKNNSINKNFCIKRVTCNGSSNFTSNQTEVFDDETLHERELTSSDVSTSNDLTNEVNSLTTSTSTVASTLPLFCLGGSFPHIDSDEESGDDAKKTQSVSCLPHDVIAPRSIQDLPEKLLVSGCYLPGNFTTAGYPLIVIESDKVHQAGLNCYEFATILLFYNTIPMNATTFVIHLIAKNDRNGHVKVVLDKLDNGLQLLYGHVKINSVLITLTEVSEEEKLKESCDDDDKRYNEQLPISHIKLVYASTYEQLLQHMTKESLFSLCNGLLEHDQYEWKEFFKTIEPLQSQCLIAGRRLVSVLNDVRNADLQGPPTRRQLHSQHRTLCRALMDTELQSLRRKGPITLARLQDQMKRIRKRSYRVITKNSANERKVFNASNISHFTHKQQTNEVIGNACKESVKQQSSTPNEENFVEQRLNGLITVFNEVDRAAKRLEQLTEQHRERLRELTRQRALEDEINEVIEWIQGEGEKSLIKYGTLSLECGDTIRDEEQDFEKYYFISMKHIAKGKDLIEAASELDSLRDIGDNLNSELKAYSIRLESLREKFEGAARLHHLLALKLNEDDIQKEMEKLAEKIGLSSLMQDKFNKMKSKKSTGKMTITTTTMITTSTPKKEREMTCDSCYGDSLLISNSILPSIEESPEKKLLERGTTAAKEENNYDDDGIDEVEATAMTSTSKLVDDSGLETFDDSFEMKDDDEKLLRACSCQSIVDDATLACDNSQHDHDDADLDDYDTSENITSISIDETTNKSESLNNIATVPLQANAHLYCHASNLQLDLDDSLIDQKTQKTLLLIIREMIGTERDYVRSLYYVIDNYMQELLREDIPQALRGQRNVIFGNIERIHEFHQQHFCKELEMYEHHPLKVGAAFLRHEPKFYLYALYNKNKPKSDSLMSEYGSSFFKSKQMELKDKMDLASYLLKPVQRMGKYALLLQQLMKACSNIQCAGNQELIEDLDELQKAEEMVRFQLRHGNDLLAMDSLRDCDVNVKEQGRLLRQNEFLVWEGRGGKKSLRQVFLFEELVLFSKARRFPDRKNLDIYIYKNSIKTSDIGLTAFVGDSPTKFEIWFRKRKPGDTWTLQSMNEEIKNTWTDEISKLLWKQAKRNREIRMAEMSSMGIGSKPCLDIRPSCDQINDRSISFSQLGKAPKFRNSFVGALPDMKSSRRPNSIISLSSSASSGGSSVSSSATCNKTSNEHSDESERNQANCRESQKDKKTLKQEKNVPCKFKYSRSTTVVSQCSTESGILADFSSLSPEECLENPLWPSSAHSVVSLKKSNSILTSVSASSGASVSTTSSSSSSSTSFGKKISSPSTLVTTSSLKSKKAVENADKKFKSNSNSSISDAYLNENNVTVHL